MMPNSSLNAQWIQLGTHIDSWGNAFPVGLPLDDLLVHTGISGTTGSGKSALLRNIALQAFVHGTNVVVLEPHGDLILHPDEGILATLPSNQLDRVTIVDPTSAMPSQINLVTANKLAGHSVAVQTVMNSLRMVDEANWNAAIRMREILENALHILLAVDGNKACLARLQRFLYDETFRQRILKKAEDDVGDSREAFERLNKALRKERDGGESVWEVPRRRVANLLRDDRLRRMLALPVLDPQTALNLPALLNQKQGQLLLIPLQANVLGDNAKRVLGSLMMQLLTQTLMQRRRDERHATLIIIDEFADLAGSMVGELTKTLLAESRKFGAAVVLATQALHQLPRDVQDEWKSNANNKIVLRTSSPDDARIAVNNLAHSELNEYDLLHIEKYCAYAKVTTGGEPQEAFYCHTQPPLTAQDVRQMQKILGQQCQTQAEESAEITLPPRDTTMERALQALYRMQPERAIQSLAQTESSLLRRLLQTQCIMSQHAAHELQQAPQSIPEPVERALQISRYRMGMPYWFYEAIYRRLRFTAK